MKTTKQQQFAQMLMNIGELYDKDITRNTLSIYWSSLKNFTLKEIQDAIQHHILDPHEGRFFPKPAHIIAHCETTQAHAAKIAWKQLQRGISEVGVYGRIAFDDPIIHLILTEMGGWVRWCHQTQTEFERKWPHFQKRYHYYLTLPSLPPYPRILSGFVSAKSEPAALISNDHKVSPYQLEEV